jgi:hypothetical protein
MELEDGLHDQASRLQTIGHLADQDALAGGHRGVAREEVVQGGK